MEYERLELERYILVGCFLFRLKGGCLGLGVICMFFGVGVVLVCREI